jgi:hypothetical protein
MRNNDLPPHDYIGIKAYAGLQNLSTPARWLWWTLVELRDNQTNIAVFKAVTSKEKQRIIGAYKELYKLDFIQRIKRQHYIVNPSIFVSSQVNIQSIATQWSDLKRKKEGSANAGL